MSVQRLLGEAVRRGGSAEPWIVALPDAAQVVMAEAVRQAGKPVGGWIISVRLNVPGKKYTAAVAIRGRSWAWKVLEDKPPRSVAYAEFDTHADATEWIARENSRHSARHGTPAVPASARVHQAPDFARPRLVKFPPLSEAVVQRGQQTNQFAAMYCSPKGTDRNVLLCGHTEDPKFWHYALPEFVQADHTLLTFTTRAELTNWLTSMRGEQDDRLWRLVPLAALDRMENMVDVASLPRVPASSIISEAVAQRGQRPGQFAVVYHLSHSGDDALLCATLGSDGRPHWQYVIPEFAQENATTTILTFNSPEEAMGWLESVHETTEGRRVIDLAELEAIPGLIDVPRVSAASITEAVRRGGRDAQWIITYKDGSCTEVLTGTLAPEPVRRILPVEDAVERRKSLRVVVFKTHEQASAWARTHHGRVMQLRSAVVQLSAVPELSALECMPVEELLTEAVRRAGSAPQWIVTYAPRVGEEKPERPEVLLCTADGQRTFMELSAVRRCNTELRGVVVFTSVEQARDVVAANYGHLLVVRSRVVPLNSVPEVAGLDPVPADEIIEAKRKRGASADEWVVYIHDEGERSIGWVGVARDDGDEDSPHTTLEPHEPGRTPYWLDDDAAQLLTFATQETARQWAATQGFGSNPKCVLVQANDLPEFQSKQRVRADEFLPRCQGH